LAEAAGGTIGLASSIDLAARGDNNILIYRITALSMLSRESNKYYEFKP
jgi:hypothetical protein